MGGMSGGGGGGQAVVQTGPSIAAAQMAGTSQYNAAQLAAQTATQNTNTAIQALMNQYTTGLQLTAPIRTYGNQAAAQMNYMLGLSPYNPGAAPTPVTLQSELGKITPQQISQYINANSAMQTGLANTSNQAFGGANSPIQSWDYSGYGSDQQAIIDATNAALAQEGVGRRSSTGDIQSPGQNYFMEQPSAVSQIGQIPGLRDAVAQGLAQQQLNLDLPTYNAQQKDWQAENDLYNQYQAKGLATPANITDIVQNLPGYQFQMQQGIQGIQNAASATGMLNSGSILQQLNQFGQGQASSFYNNYMGQLQGLAGLGAGQTAQAAQYSNQLGSNIANQYGQLTDNVGNAYLAQGQAMASSYLTPLQNQEMRVTNIGGGGGGGSGLGGLLGGIGSVASAFGGGGGLLGGLL